MSTGKTRQLLRKLFARDPALATKARSLREWRRLKNLGISYAYIDPAATPKNYNVAGFLRDQKTPKK